MRLASVGWSLKLMACVGNSVLKQGPYDLYDFFSFPAGAAVATRLGAVLVAPSLLAKMEALSKMEDPSAGDYRAAGHDAAEPRAVEVRGGVGERVDAAVE